MSLMQEMMTVVAQRELVPRVFELVLRGDLVAQMRQPGQFLHLKVDNDAMVLRRPISIASIDLAAGTCTIIYRVEGGGTAAFSKLTAGDQVDVMGPLGTGFPVEGVQAGEKVLLIGGGIGVPPLFELARQLQTVGAEATILLGFGDSAQAFYLDEFAPLGDVRVSTDDGSLGVHGHVGVLLAALEEEGYQPDAVYSCGAPGMLRFVDAKFKDHPNAYVSMEARMACGMGACYACVCHLAGDNDGSASKRVCLDGPVFKTGEVVI